MADDLIIAELKAFTSASTDNIHRDTNLSPIREEFTFPLKKKIPTTFISSLDLRGYPKNKCDNFLTMIVTDNSGKNEIKI